MELSETSQPKVFLYIATKQINNKQIKGTLSEQCKNSKGDWQLRYKPPNSNTAAELLFDYVTDDKGLLHELPANIRRYNV